MKVEERCRTKMRKKILKGEGGDGAEDVLFWFLWHFLSNEAVN